MSASESTPLATSIQDYGTVMQQPELRRRKWYSKYSASLELDNKGSTARDSLAAERTYLAWLRTSLSLASIGVAITQLFRLTGSTSIQISQAPDSSADATIAALIARLDAQAVEIAALQTDMLRPDRHVFVRLGKPIGSAMILAGILILLMGCNRFFQVQSALVKGKFPPARASIIFSAVLIGGITIAAITAILILE